MRVVIFLLLFLELKAGVLDSYYIYRAKSLQSKGYYLKALRYYKKLPQKSDTILYNLANIYYYLKRYDKALMIYKSIETPRLQSIRLYNMANCYFKKHNYQKAKRFYEATLKFSPKDFDTLFNLRVTREILKNLVDKKEIASNSLKRSKGVGSGKYEGKVASWDSNFEANTTLKDAKYSSKLIKRNNISNSSKERGDGSENSKDLKDSNRTIIETKEGSFSLENKRYRYILDKKRLNTLLIPLITKEIDDKSY